MWLKSIVHLRKKWKILFEPTWEISFRKFWGLFYSFEIKGQLYKFLKQRFVHQWCIFLNIYFCFIDYVKAFVWITKNYGKFFFFFRLLICLFFYGRIIALQNYVVFNKRNWILIQPKLLYTVLGGWREGFTVCDVCVWCVCVMCVCDVCVCVCVCLEGWWLTEGKEDLSICLLSNWCFGPW